MPERVILTVIMDQMMMMMMMMFGVLLASPTCQNCVEYYFTYQSFYNISQYTCAALVYFKGNSLRKTNVNKS